MKIQYGKYSLHIYTLLYYTAQAAFGPFIGYWFSGQGLSSQQIGLLFSIAPVLGLFIQPVWGTLCDRYGLERVLLMLSTLLTPCVAFGYLFAGERYWLYVITALGLALTTSSMSPISEALTVSHAQKQGLSYGGIRVFGSISFAITVTLIGVWYKKIGVEHMFLVYLGAMVFLFSSLFLLEKPRIRQGRGRLQGGIKQFLANRQFVCFLIIMFVISVGSAANNVFFSVYLREISGDVSDRIGVLNMVAALSELPFFIYAGRLIRRFGYFPILSFVGLTAAVRWFLLSWDQSFGVLIGAQLLHGITFALFTAAGINFVHNASSDGLKTTGQTLLAIVNSSLAMLVASNGGGWLIKHEGFSFMYQMSALSCTLGAIGFIWLFLNTGKASSHDSQSISS